jgi:hypothetical protein
MKPIRCQPKIHELVRLSVVLQKSMNSIWYLSWTSMKGVRLHPVLMRRISRLERRPSFVFFSICSEEHLFLDGSVSNDKISHDGIEHLTQGAKTNTKDRHWSEMVCHCSSAGSLDDFGHVFYKEYFHNSLVDGPFLPRLVPSFPFFGSFG